jgi:hypothetical protein
MGKDTLDATIRGGLYRCESFESFSKIYKDGYIYPRDEKNPSKWSNSYAQYIGAVALFDFKNQSDEDFNDSKWKWARFFSVEFMPVAIGIGFDWKALSPKIIPYDNERFDEATKLKKRLISYVECWYPEPISLEYMTHVIVVCSVMKNIFKLLKPSGEIISEIINVITEYQNKYSKAYENHERLHSMDENAK